MSHLCYVYLITLHVKTFVIRQPKPPTESLGAYAHQSNWHPATPLQRSPSHMHHSIVTRNIVLPPQPAPQYPWPTPPSSAHSEAGPNSSAADICPFSNCQRRCGRPQDLERHVLQHLPHCIYCPQPDCQWTGTRRYTLRVHLETKHDGAPLPEQETFTIYDAKGLVKQLMNKDITVALVEYEARSLFQKKAVQLGMLGYWH
ncbi:hypothetical protein F5148DRAFT_470292 [Russula earlei]|uniref:Uncharacterized protein n=1 Tax=Russula earlei TaxID=71964 RepID=A0ACC0UPA2_9AGAM|nr:hypothetical protein F5148DRAFT_470292 [Russula earlei]